MAALFSEDWPSTSVAFCTAAMIVPRSLLWPVRVLMASSVTRVNSTADPFRARLFAAMRLRLFRAVKIADFVWSCTELMRAMLAFRPCSSWAACSLWDSHRCLASSALDCSPSTERSTPPSSVTMPCTLDASMGCVSWSMCLMRRRIPWVSTFLRSAVSISSRKSTGWYALLDFTSSNERLRAATCSSTVYLPLRRSMRPLSVFSCACREDLTASTRSAFVLMASRTAVWSCLSMTSTALVKVMLKVSSSVFCSCSASTPCCSAPLAAAVAAWSARPCCRTARASRDCVRWEPSRAWIVRRAATVRPSSAGVMRTRGGGPVCASNGCFVAEDGVNAMKTSGNFD
mmetsp:Transcript_98663/g.318120  ORF Transcript_98663/g.318120 Transcript_98663/m.318120 type:complete len:344 (-) Transcript_98663:525-1556(-)